MSKYSELWKTFDNKTEKEILMTFSEIEKIIGFSIDHSFLKYKGELSSYGYSVERVYLKEKKIKFTKISY